MEVNWRKERTRDEGPAEAVSYVVKGTDEQR